MTVCNSATPVSRPWRDGDLLRDASFLIIPNYASFLPLAGDYVLATDTQPGFDEAGARGIPLAVDGTCTP
jgi:hypothetical protein